MIGKKARKIPVKQTPRGFELLHTLRGHKEWIFELAWSPNGNTLASSSWDKTIGLWDVESGDLCQTLSGHTSMVFSVAWSPDGKTLASGASDGTILLWDVQSDELRQTLEKHGSAIYSMAWSPDGQMLVSGSQDKTIRFWETESGKLCQTIEGQGDTVYSVAWSPNGRTLASGCQDTIIRLWDPESGKLQQMLKGHHKAVTAVTWSPDGRILVSGANDGTIILWDGKTVQQKHILEDQTKQILCIRFSPDGRLLISKSQDGSVRLWRSDTWEPVAALEESSRPLHGGLAFHPHRPLLSTRGEDDQSIRLWQLDYNLLFGDEIPPETRYDSEKELISAGELASSPELREPIEDLQPDRLPPAQKEFPPGLTLLYPLQGFDKVISEIAWSPDGRILASSGADQMIRLWDAQGGKLLQTLEGHTDWVSSVTWSPDGQTLASGSFDRTIRLWDVQSGKLCQTLEGHHNDVSSVTWAPDGRTLASGARDQTICLWNTQSGDLLHTLEGHRGPVYHVAWSPDGTMLASASFDKTIRLWDGQHGTECRQLKGHGGAITTVTWSPDGRTLASGAHDNTIRLWDAESGRQMGILESHTDTILDVQFSPEGRLLVSKSDDGTVRFWRYAKGELVAELHEPTDVLNFRGLAFHPTETLLATRGERDRVIRIWQLDYNILLSIKSYADARYYRNAKVVLVGDTGVGKTGLALGLTGQPWEPTESTHGRHVWTFDSHKAKLPDGLKETRETLLWDLAGQPGYRLIHQLHLNEVVVALVVFDSRSETGWFNGVRYWARALYQARRLQGDEALPLTIFLVAARCDRGGVLASRDDINGLIRKFDFDDYFETSAKEGWQIPELIAAIRESIQWDTLLKVTSNELFQNIKQFLIDEKQAGRLLAKADELYHLFCQRHPTLTENEQLWAEFNTCIIRVENRGLIRCLSFANYVLLQPELLDAYASAIVNAAGSDPEGLGCILEEEVLLGCFPMSQDERIADKEQEKLLLIATEEELLHHELVFKEVTDAGTALVFPSQLTRERIDNVDLPGTSVVFTFQGPLLNVYATLAVRLAHSFLFEKQEMWKDVATYTATVGGTCGIAMREIDEGHGELTIFFDEQASEATRYQFEEYVAAHLKRMALPNTLQRRRIIICQNCSMSIPDSMVTFLRDRGRKTMDCPACNTELSLLDREECLGKPDRAALMEMDRAADTQRERDTATMVLKGKIESGEFDVFLCHNSQDKAAVKEIGGRLKERGILPWLDEWEFRPGLRWQKVLDEQIAHIKSVVVFIGPQGFGPWQDLEVDAFLRQFVKREAPVIPVILPECEEIPKLPPFLEGMMWVDFRKDDPDPLEQLIWGITGERNYLR